MRSSCREADSPRPLVALVVDDGVALQSPDGGYGGLDFKLIGDRSDSFRERIRKEYGPPTRQGMRSPNALTFYEGADFFICEERAWDGDTKCYRSRWTIFVPAAKAVTWGVAYGLDTTNWKAL